MSKLCYEAVVMKTEWWGNFQPGKHYCNNNNSNKQLRNTVAAWTLSVKLEKSIPYIHTEYAYRQCINIETGRKVNYESIEKNILFSLLLSNTEKRLMHAPGYPRSLPYLHTHTQTHTDDMYRSPAFQSWPMSALLWFMHTYANPHKQTRTTARRWVVHLNVTTCVHLHKGERSVKSYPIKENIKCTMRHFNKEKKLLRRIKCSTDM